MSAQCLNDGVLVGPLCEDPYELVFGSPSSNDTSPLVQVDTERNILYMFGLTTGSAADGLLGGTFLVAQNLTANETLFSINVFGDGTIATPKYILVRPLDSDANTLRLAAFDAATNTSFYCKCDALTGTLTSVQSL